MLNIDRRVDAGCQQSNPFGESGFVVEKWSGDTKVWINGQPAKSGGSVHIGSSHSIEHDDLVLWMQLSSKVQRNELRFG
jgi:hypothetical protein